MATMMKCGHVAQGQVSKTGQPVCVICDCYEVAEEEPDLTGRMAKCPYCGHMTPSQMTLPFFGHRPDHENDDYYCGCRGWG